MGYNIGYSFRLAARDFYMFHPTYSSTYQDLCYTSYAAAAGTRNNLVGSS